MPGAGPLPSTGACIFPAEPVGIWVCDSDGVPIPRWTSAPPAESAFGDKVWQVHRPGQGPLSQREMEVVGRKVMGSAEGLMMESRLPQALGCRKDGSSNPRFGAGKKQVPRGVGIGWSREQHLGSLCTRSCLSALRMRTIRSLKHNSQVCTQQRLVQSFGKTKRNGEDSSLPTALFSRPCPELGAGETRCRSASLQGPSGVLVFGPAVGLIGEVPGPELGSHTG